GPSSGGQHVITVDSGDDLTLSGHLSNTSAQDMIKDGAGTLILSNNNSTFTGAITVKSSGGILQITTATPLGNTSQRTRIGTNAQLQSNGVTGSIAENLTLNGPGPANDGALLNVAGTNTLTGNVVLDTDTTLGANSGTTLIIQGVISDTSTGHNLTKEGA